MKNPLKNANQQLLESELAGFEFDAKMKKKVLEQIHSPSKASKIKKLNTLFPVVLSACLVILFFIGIYKFILSSNQERNPADYNPDRNITIENNKKPPIEDEANNIPQIENENDTKEKETVDPEPITETNTEQKEDITETEPATKELAETEKSKEEKPNYFDEEFISLAKKGFIKGLPLPVGSTVGEIKKMYGEPLEYDTDEGAYLLVYQDFNYAYPATVDYRERANVSDDVITVGATFFLKDELYLSDMKKDLGEPASSGVSLIDQRFHIVYYLDNYNLDAITESGEEGVLKRISLTDWSPR